jgi:hypothetical protein
MYSNIFYSSKCWYNVQCIARKCEGNFGVDGRIILKLDIREMEFESMNCIPLAQQCLMERLCEQGNEPSGPITAGDYLAN